MRWTAIALVASAAMLCFHRFQLAQGFARAFGDRYDAMIEVSILQHWQNVLLGREAWNQTAYFHPASDTLGYNDGYLLYGIVYALARAVGASPVSSAEIVHAVFKLAGFLGMYVLLKGPFGCRWGWSLFGAALFAIADLTLQHANHGQLFTVAFVPWAALLLWRGTEALMAGDGKRLLRYGVGLAALFAGWISTALYLAWFFAFFCLLLVAVLILRAGRAGRRRIAARLWQARVPLAALTVVSLVLLLPFLRVYLPKAAETGGHGYASLARTTFSLYEYFNPGTHHLLWSPLFDVIRRDLAPGLQTDRDAVFGFAPLLFALSVVAILRARRAGAGPVVGAVALAIAISWLLLLDLFGFSLWAVIYALVPGAHAIRVIGRFQLVLLVPCIALVTVLLDRTRRPRLAVTAAALLLAEQLMATAAPVRLDKAEQAAMLAAIPPPPGRCRVFYVRSARPYSYPPQDPWGDRLYPHNVDAMVLSEWFARPTINGYSTFTPPYWDFADPEAPDYEARASRYAARFGITGLCELDLRRGRVWTPAR